MSIYLTGASGFVGKNLISYFKNKIEIKKHVRDSEFLIKEKTVIHLAGKAHDLKNSSNKDEYYEVNTELTKQIFDSFLTSDSRVFIYMSSVKAVADSVVGILSEDYVSNPKTHYGKSKLLAERYILSKKIPNNKRVYILRPCMIHGPNNKGNLNLLYSFVARGIPYPFGKYENQRSFVSVENLCFVISQLIEKHNTPSGVYNIADDHVLSTKELVTIIGEVIGRKPIILNLPKGLVRLLAKIGDSMPFPINSHRLDKLTESYVVSNSKIKKALQIQLPLSSRKGLKLTIESFKL
jgi:nucleoside-diphosphate-sugar epimerase